MHRKKMSLLEYIFSIKDVDLRHKQICILGIRVKIRKPIKLYSLYKNLPVENNKIIFRTFNGGYSCNPKYIAEEIIKQDLPYKLVWVVNKNILDFIDDFPRNKIKLVMNNTAEEIKETLTAKIIIDNERRTSYINNGILKKTNQIYIQTFHGSLGIKKTGSKRKDLSHHGFKLSQIDSKQIDFLISNSTYTTNFFKQIFFNNGTILKTGHPRNDIFFKLNENIKEKIFSYYNIPVHKKILMYAPTLRESGDLDCYAIDFAKTMKAISKKFSGEWVIMTRLHPLLIDKCDEVIPQHINIIDSTKYPDMQELLVSVDVLITDYSSCIYDFMLSYKPGFIFATDIKQYDNERGLYYPLTSTPFPVAENNDELIKNIENFDYETYKIKVKEFLDNKGCIDDGHASERVVELIKEIIANAENGK